MSSPEHKEYVWNLIKEIKVGMLTTVDPESNSLRSRPMKLVQDAYDGTLYFFTPKDDSKVFEVKKHNDVNISFSDSDKQIYVSLSGEANLSQDAELIKKYWNRWAEAWFKEGQEDPNVAMLVVKINKGEHWKTDENELIQLYEMAKANINDKTPDVGENVQFG